MASAKPRNDGAGEGSLAEIETRASVFKHLHDPTQGAQAWERFDKIYRIPCMHWLQSLAWCFIPNDIEDVVQWCWAKLHREQFQYDEEGNFRGYITTMMRHRTRDVARSNARYKAHCEKLERLCDLPASPEADLRWERETRAAWLIEAERKVRDHYHAIGSPKTFEVYELRSRGVPPDEVAKRLGLSVEQVNTYFSRVKKRIREYLGESSDED
jgi:RNA polymerase sigma factor (sigma-70 family)